MRRASWVVPVLALSWIVLYLVSLHLSGWPAPPRGQWWQVGRPNPDVLLELGALVPARVELGAWQRLVTHAFLHLFALHLLLNLWVGWSAGRSLERIAGAARTWIVFFASAVGGGILLVLMAKGTGRGGLAVGASAGIFGWVGALAVWAFGSRAPEARAARRGIVFFLLIAGALSFLPGVGLWGHAGGLLAGAVTMLLLGPRRSEARDAGRLLGALAVAFGLVTLVAGVVQAARPAVVERAAVAPLLRDLAATERLARRLYRDPVAATPEDREDLGRRLAALRASTVLQEPAQRAALHAYLDAWKPVADANVPDPFAFEARLDEARKAWREVESHLRAAANLPRGL